MEKFKGGNTSQSKCEGGEREFVSFGSELGTLNNSQVNSILWASLCSYHSATALSRPPPCILFRTHTNYQVAVNCILRLCSAQLLLALVASQWNQSYINCTNNSAHSLCNGQASSTPLTPLHTATTSPCCSIGAAQLQPSRRQRRVERQPKPKESSLCSWPQCQPK